MTTTYGTLSTIPGFPVDVRLVRRGAQSPAESGQVARRQFRSSASRQSSKLETRVWRLTFGPEDLPALLATFDAALGQARAVSWTPPPPDDGAAIPVRFVDGTLRVRKGPGVLYEADVELEEVG